MLGVWCDQQDQESGGCAMMNHKHYTFQVIDNTSKKNMPKGSLLLSIYLKAKMNYYIAENNLQKEVKGDEWDYINMLTQEYAADGVPSS
jgi:hypothetical protein